jgi:hypothetical protein
MARFSKGPLWDRMDAQPRRLASELRRSDVPLAAGVYAWYRDGQPVYVGKADELRGRAWSNHMGQSSSMGTSAFRRNVAEYLGYGAPADIKAKRIRLTAEQLADVRAWIVACHVAWIESPDAAAAKRLEAAMKTEWMPPLTKQ